MAKELLPTALLWLRSCGRSGIPCGWNIVHTITESVGTLFAANCSFDMKTVT
jgi:hypothetical protein